MVDLPLRCRCGTLRGAALDVTPGAGNHVVCTCEDCQAYLHFLDRADVLDPRGGTHIFQLTPAQLRISEGADRMACVRLTERGVLRWYAGCCRTPVANSSSRAWLPFAGILLVLLDPALDARTRDAALGPVLATAFPRSAIGGLQPGESPRPPVGLILRSVGLIARAALRGRHRPSPFFDPDTGRPVVTPKRLTESERAAVYARTRAHAAAARA